MLSLKFLYSSPLGAMVTSLLNRTEKERALSKEIIPADRDASLDDDPLRARYVKSVPKAQLYRGVLLQGYLAPPTVLQGLDNFEIRPDDLFIVTYPKSGTTWMEEIVSLIYNDGDLSKVKDKLLAYRVNHLEVGRPIGHLRHLRKQKSPRLMATHLPLPLIPRQLRQVKCKIIYVVRNPKDNAVSYYHHHRMSTFLGNSKGSWDEFLTHYMKGHVVYGCWFDHVLPYWHFYLDHRDRVLFISYEELKMDLPGMVAVIADFLGWQLSPEAMKVIAQHCSFDQMKRNNMVNREVLPISDLFDMTQSKFMRKGIVGDWKNYFTTEQNHAFDELYRDRMEGSGLDLVFEPDEAELRMTTHGRLILTPPQVPSDTCLGESSSQLEGENSSPHRGRGNSNVYPKPCYGKFKQAAFDCDIEKDSCVPGTITSPAIHRSSSGRPYQQKMSPPYMLQLHVQPDPLSLDVV